SWSAATAWCCCAATAARLSPSTITRTRPARPRRWPPCCRTGRTVTSWSATRAPACTARSDGESMSLPNAQPGPFARLAEKLVFSNRPLILVLFAAITAAMVYFAMQLEVDAGFKKQIPLEHEYMQTFLEYEADFGGANRVLVAVVAKDGDMFDQAFMKTLENVTNDVINLDSTDDARSRSLFTPNVRFIEVVEDGLSGGNVIPSTFTPNVEGFEATPEDFEAIRGNIVKAGIVGRLVARDYSGAMIWADLIPESEVNKVDYQEVAEQFED